MVDLHNHLLHGLDDGSPDLATSVEMARDAAGDGLTHMVCTPHASNNYPFQPALIARKLDELRSALAAESIPLTLASGCDFHLSYDNIADATAHPRKYTLNNTPYLLVELPDLGIPPTIDRTFYELRLAGMTPILTHPERNGTLQHKPELLKEWLRSGMLIQVTANSVTGGMGRHAQAMALELLDKRWVHFLATDAHNLTSRPARLSEAHATVAKRCSIDYADLLCLSNPTAVFHGSPLPAQEEPLGLFTEQGPDDDHEYDEFGARLPWYKRLFRR